MNESLIDLCFGELRGYFNRRTVRAIVERTSPAKHGFARAAVEYCERAHFQAVADEYLYLCKNVLQRNTPSDMARHLGRVLGVGTGSPNINLTTATGRICTEQLVRRAHFALPFGEDLRAEQGSPLEPSGSSRKTAVREAFNRRSGRLYSRLPRSAKRGSISIFFAATSCKGVAADLVTEGRSGSFR